MADDAGAVVYGTMLVATLLAAESPGRETYAETSGAVAVAVLVSSLAHAYSAFTDDRARGGRAFTLRGVRGVLAHELAVIAGASVPLLVVLACWAAGARLATAVAIAMGVAIATIILTEVALGIRSDHDGHELLARTALGIVVGVAILAIKLLLH